MNIFQRKSKMKTKFEEFADQINTIIKDHDKNLDITELYQIVNSI